MPAVRRPSRVSTRVGRSVSDYAVSFGYALYGQCSAVWNSEIIQYMKGAWAMGIDIRDRQ